MSAATRQVWFVNAAHSFTHYSLLILATAVLGIVVQEPERFGRDYGPVIALGTTMFVVYGLGALPMGWLQDRLGRRALMAASSSLASSCFCCSALSCSTRSTFPRASTTCPPPRASAIMPSCHHADTRRGHMGLLTPSTWQK